MSPHYGADGSFARLASTLADTHTAVETATGCFFASQPPFRISPPAPIKKSRRQKAVGIFGADGSFARLASALADTHAAVETATGCFFASQPAFSNLFACTNKKSRRQKAVGIFGADGEIRTLAAVTHPTPLAGAPRHQLEYICKTVNLNTHCQVVAPIRCLINIPKRSKKVNTKFI